MAISSATTLSPKRQAEQEDPVADGTSDGRLDRVAGLASHRIADCRLDSVADDAQWCRLDRELVAQPPPEVPAAPIAASILRAAIDQAVDSIVIADAMGRIVYAKPATERYIGQRVSDIIGRHFVVALAEGDHPAAYDSRQHVVRSSSR